MPLDPTKPLQTKSGERVELIITNGREPYPWIGYRGQSSLPDSWTANSGKYKVAGTDFLDLINVPEKVTKYTNVYSREPGSYTTGALYDSHERAEAARTEHCIATVPITFEV